MKIVCIGDSLTYGYRVKRASVWTALASRALLYSEIINSGVNGDTTGGMLSRFEKDVMDHAPDMVFIMGGSNDIFFSGSIKQAKANVAAMAFQCMHYSAVPLLGIPLPVYDAALAEEWKPFAAGDHVRMLLEEYQEWIAEFAHSFGLHAVDFRQCVPSDDVNLKKFYLDGIHASEEGHRKMADLWMESVAKVLVK